MFDIKGTAISLGFDACGIAKADILTEDAAFLQKWLNEGKQGDMHYLDRNFEKRTDPRKLVPGCKSVVVVLMNYYPEKQQVSSAPQIAKYAYPETDYHITIKAKLNTLEEKICEAYGVDAVSQEHQHTFVDSAPVLERRWAERAGLGWIGKHTQLINLCFGSYTFIGIMMLNIELAYDQPIRPKCGTCTRCIDSCPTKALTNGSLDARRCISYLTIENKKEIPIEFHALLSDRALGCDICADICPWNTKLAKPHQHIDLQASPSLLEWKCANWQQLTKEDFDQAFRHSAIKRAGYAKLKQNIDVVTRNLMM